MMLSACGCCAGYEIGAFTVALVGGEQAARPSEMVQDLVDRGLLLSVLNTALMLLVNRFC